MNYADRVKSDYDLATSAKYIKRCINYETVHVYVGFLKKCSSYET